ncbi:MAG: hypothetical protein MUE36_06970, partial [Acidimicrobiales bacterium]|nr:hypothetical protein [Acidimicrobiales bacterium]
MAAIVAANIARQIRSGALAAGHFHRRRSGRSPSSPSGGCVESPPEAQMSASADHIKALVRSHADGDDA